MKISVRTIIPLLCCMVFVTSCKPRAEEIAPERLRELYGLQAISHTVYCGSDKAFHYFSHSSPDENCNGQYKIGRKALKVVGEFGRGETEPELFVFSAPCGEDGTFTITVINEVPCFEKQEGDYGIEHGHSFIS